jgi:hypothetical protein
MPVPPAGNVGAYGIVREKARWGKRVATEGYGPSSLCDIGHFKKTPYRPILGGLRASLTQSNGARHGLWRDEGGTKPVPPSQTVRLRV